MSKILKVLLISAYAILFIVYIQNSMSNKIINVLEIEYLYRKPDGLKAINRNLKKIRMNYTEMKLNYKDPIRFPTDLKFILRWTEAYSNYDDRKFKDGQHAFINANCKHINCYMTNEKGLLNDLRNFDAILFDVENNWDSHPIFRSPRQKFIFMASESASNFPVCHPYYDLYYNWTWSYRLNSDIVKPFVYIYNKKGELVGPKVNITWINPMRSTPEGIKKILKNKKKAVAWFVSSCRTQSHRELVANNLTRALKKYNLKIDIYGWCGKLTCPRDRMGDCLGLIEENYYFYLSFENSLSEDYVTEKVMHALIHHTVPIVYGGADYSRFLPPGSYINAGELDAVVVASLMNEAMKNPEVYENYFRWHNYYEYKEKPAEPDVCTLCRMLNEPEQKYSVIKDFRKWWNPNYENLCKNELIYQIPTPWT